jgi:hypothetical protein
MACRSEPRFKSYKEFTDKDKREFKDLYMEILKENKARNDVEGYLENLGNYGYELHIGYPHECTSVSIKSQSNYGEKYSISFKVNKSRKIEKLTPVKGLESYELHLSEELYWKVIDFLESIIYPQMTGFERRENALAMRKRVQNRLHGKTNGGKRRTIKRKTAVRRKKLTRRNKK